MRLRISRQEALTYHDRGQPGKVALDVTKPCATPRDLSLAYTPGVAEPVQEIARDPEMAYAYTGRGNLVAVVSNGTAVLGMGDVGALASKPVMEGKAVLFKRLADINAFDIELDAQDPEEVVQVIRAIAPGFGGINVEDIKAPDCFAIEEALRKSLDIPVFHDDQHGTAVVVGAGLLNALHVVGKRIEEVRVVISGAGAAGLACAGFLVSLGVKKQNLVLCDSHGVLYEDRPEGMHERMLEFARETSLRTLAEALVDADVFLGLSVAGVVTGEMLKTMAPKPIVFALANPDPEISYEEACTARPDAIVATGRSDYPNQLNNALGFPYVFRGALDVRATQINEAMKLAAARSLAALAREEVPESLCRLYGEDTLCFGADYIIPKVLDPRLLSWVAPAVAEAAMASGVARVQVDLVEYRLALESRFTREQEIQSNFLRRAQRKLRTVVFPEGEIAAVVRAAARLQQDGLVQPVLLGRPEVVVQRLAKLGSDVELHVVDPSSSRDLRVYADTLFRVRQRKGLTRQEALRLMQMPTYFAAMMVHRGAADAMVGGVVPNAGRVLEQALQVIGTAPGIDRVAGMYFVLAQGHTFFFTDPVVNVDPTSEQLAGVAIEAASYVRAMGIEPHIAMLSFSNFGSHRHPYADKMRRAAELVKAQRPELIVDGEMQADTAVTPEILESDYPFSDLTGMANVLVFPDLDAASIALKLVQRLGDAEVSGPVFLGLAKPVYVTAPDAEAAEIIKTAIAAAASVRA
jgi:malate dehydrogenase (oxaloacetate-decarboxylating)(NADP+)